MVVRVIGGRVDPCEWDYVVDKVLDTAKSNLGGYVCVCNVHMLVVANTDVRFNTILDTASLVIPDGAPVAWALRRAGFRRQKRVNGPDLMWDLLKHAERSGLITSFYGGSQSTLDRLIENVKISFPDLRLGVAISPPQLKMDQLRSDNDLNFIESVGTNILFVGLGCPKQEYWMYENTSRFSGVMLGVGAAFDFHSGVLKRAPRWMRDVGLEWLFRLLTEPRRLWRRYFYGNILFLFRLFLDGFAAKIEK